MAIGPHTAEVLNSEVRACAACSLAGRQGDG
jgi:hypothetical protein